jgi:hypothetical protein
MLPMRLLPSITYCYEGRTPNILGAVVRGLVNGDGTVVTFSEIQSCDNNEGGNCIALTTFDRKFSMVVVSFTFGSLPTGKYTAENDLM